MGAGLLASRLRDLGWGLPTSPEEQKAVPRRPVPHTFAWRFIHCLPTHVGTSAVSDTQCWLRGAVPGAKSPSPLPGPARTQALRRPNSCPGKEAVCARDRSVSRGGAVSWRCDPRRVTRRRDPHVCRKPGLHPKPPDLHDPAGPSQGPCRTLMGQGCV